MGNWRRGHHCGCLEPSIVSLLQGIAHWGSVQNVNRRSVVSGAIGVIALAGLSSSVSAQVSYDLRTGGAVVVNGAVFFAATSLSVSTPSGTGVYNAFYKLNTNQAIEEGYNTGIKSAMPHVAQTPNLCIRLNNLTVPANNPIPGVNYYSFGLDINEPNNPNRLLSVDNVEVWISATQLNPANTYAALASGGAQRIYSLDQFEDSEILTDYSISGGGSGRADMLFLVPQTLFPATLGGKANYYIYLYSRFGGKGGVWSNNQGFEEWQTVAGLNFTFVPEAHTWAAGICLAGLAGAAWMRRRSPSTVA